MLRNKPNQQIGIRGLKAKEKSWRSPRTGKMHPRRRANQAGAKA
jgi:hypothetical protein